MTEERLKYLEDKHNALIEYAEAKKQLQYFMNRSVFEFELFNPKLMTSFENERMKNLKLKDVFYSANHIPECNKLLIEIKRLKEFIFDKKFEDYVESDYIEE